MLLEDAKTKEEVATAIAEGDQEMIDSVDAFLEEARDSFMSSDAHYGEEESPVYNGISDVVTDNEAFLDMVISESESTNFDLSKIPRELVKKNLEYTCSGEADGERGGLRRGFSHWGPFAIAYPDDRDSPSLEWRYRLQGSRSISFNENHFPDTKLAALIPEDKAKDFWKDLAMELSSWTSKRNKDPDFDWSDVTSTLSDNYGWGIGADYGLGSYDDEKFAEWCRDIFSEHVNNIIDSDPKAAYEMFLSSAKLTDGVKALLQKGQSVADAEGDEWPTEEVMDFVVKYFEQEDEGERADQINSLDNFLIKTYDPESLVPDFLADVERFLSSTHPDLLSHWGDALSTGFFTKENIAEMAGNWLDDGRYLANRRGSEVGTTIKEELQRYIFEKNPGAAVDNFVNEVTEALKKTPVGEAGADVVRKAIEEKEFSKKNVLEMAFNWTKGQKRQVIEELEDYADAIMKGAEIPEHDALVTVSKADIAKLGITTGYLAEEGPFKLIKLRPQDLRAEGRRMRHCVGDSPSYARGVADGSKEIWSLRDRNNKPHFTLEIDTGIHKYQPGDAGIEDESSDDHRWAKQRALFVKQLKGKTNRTPGFAERSSGSITKPEEVILWKWLLKKKLRIHPDQVVDFSAARMSMPKAQRSEQLQASFTSRSTQRLSARLDALADSLRGKKSARQLVAMIDDAAFLLAE
jgi:hypothetical protein